MEFKIKDENGKRITQEALREKAVAAITEVLDGLDTSDALDISNQYRDRNGEDMVYRNERENVNEVIGNDGGDYYDVLDGCYSGYDSYYDFFTFDGDFNMTNDVWGDLDAETVADDIMEYPHYYDYNGDIEEILDAYETATEELNKPVNEYREELRKAFTDFKANTLTAWKFAEIVEKIVNTDSAWTEGED